MSSEDFERIRQLRHRKMVEGVMRKHGLKSAAKRERLLAEAQDEADEALAEQASPHPFHCHERSMICLQKHLYSNKQNSYWL